ncbi:MAG TPA: methyltransferase domain-containing protein [Allosphingosinicella sp.]|nr:methyltransferase domain-containing protein [Allosphingosinicella sp.]
MASQMPQEPTRNTPFDRALRRLRRDRAAREKRAAGYLHRRAAEDMYDRLDSVNRRFETALVIGCSDNWLCDRLRDRGLRVLTCDPGALFTRNAVGFQCDEDFLPLADASVDLVMAVGTLDSVNDLPGALTLVRRILVPDGLMLAAFAGAGSLPRLRSALRAAEEAQQLAPSPRIHPQIDVRAAGDLLMRAGFALPVVDSDKVNVRYPGLIQLVRDLRAMAATNLLCVRARHPFGRLGLTAAVADFASAADSDGKTEESFVILHLSGWAPSADQPRPARRGSATASLADALGKFPPPSDNHQG